MRAWPREVILRVPREQASGGTNAQGLRECSVDEDGTVWARDPVSGEYTRHHGLTPEHEDEVRRAAQREALII